MNCAEWTAPRPSANPRFRYFGPEASFEQLAEASDWQDKESIIGRAPSPSGLNLLQILQQARVRGLPAELGAGADA